VLRTSLKKIYLNKEALQPKMIFATLGKLDLITVLILIGAAVLPQKLLLFAAIYLLIKGGIFILLNRDFASYGDFISGIYMFLLAYGIRLPFVHEIILFWLIQKTAMTFLALAIRLFLFYQEHKQELPDFLN
jgi:hypothetical protein